MTVSDLIKRLEEYPKDLQVRTYSGDVSIEAVDEYYDGDPANPRCPVIQALVIS